MRNGFQTLLLIVQNDYGYDLNFSLQDSAGAVLDLTGATLQFVAQQEANDLVNFTGSMVVTNASGGQCQYVVRQTDFVQSGTWSAQIVVTYASGEVITFTGITLQVDPRLPL